jgi:phage N-6-adenine-methyltransferase
MIEKGWLTSKRGDWRTPTEFFKKLNERFDFDLDVCASQNNALCENYYTIENNALNHTWHDKYRRAYMNPPYGRGIQNFMKKAHEESQNMLVVCLVPSRTDTRWWWDYVMPHKVEFVKGRLKFDDGNSAAPFPSAVVIMGQI